jgi:DNA-binding response OmpR family regulator
MTPREAAPPARRRRRGDAANRRPPLVARDREGRSLTQDVTPLLLPGERLQPAARRVLRVLLSEEGRLFTFDELATLASVGGPGNDTLDRADRLHRHIHYIRRALIPDCLLLSLERQGFRFRRRKTASAPARDPAEPFIKPLTRDQLMRGR